MDFSEGDDRRMLADTIDRYLRDRYAIEARHAIAGSAAGWSAERWAELAEIGVPAALAGEAAGGFGGGGFDIGVVFRSLGRALVVEPFLGLTMALRVLAVAGTREALAADAVAGAAIIAFAHEEAGARGDPARIGTRARPDGDGWRLTGTKAVVPQLAAASHVLVTARTEGGATGLFLVEAGAQGCSVRDYPLIDGGRGGELSLDDAPAILIAEDAAPLVEEAIAAGIVALAWEAVAIMEVLRDATLDYLRTRKQFGVPIGRFQALQHRMATVALEIEQARSAAINAADALGGERTARERAVSAAKFTVGRVGTLVAEEAIQLHGGIGMTWELPLPHYAKRLTMIGHELGDEDYHLARFTALGRERVSA